MRDNFNHLSKSRIRIGILGSEDSDGRRGAFHFKDILELNEFICIVDCGEQSGWEHVSARARTLGASTERNPTWNEMCFIKSQFWKAEETVIQYHPKESEYVNLHGNVLHLWRPLKVEIPMPPIELV